jgi:hypothetical protein
MARTSGLLVAALVACLAAGALANPPEPSPNEAALMRLGLHVHGVVNNISESLGSPAVAALDSALTAASGAERQGWQYATLLATQAAANGNAIADGVVANGGVAAGRAAVLGNQIMDLIDNHTANIQPYVLKTVDQIVTPLTQSAENLAQFETDAITGAIRSVNKAVVGTYSGANKALNTAVPSLNLTQLAGLDYSDVHGFLTPYYDAATGAVVLLATPAVNKLTNLTGKVQLAVSGVTHPLLAKAGGLASSAVDAGVEGLKSAVTATVAATSGLNTRVGDLGNSATEAARPITISLANGAQGAWDASSKAALEAAIAGAVRLASAINSTYSLGKGAGKSISAPLGAVTGHLTNATRPLVDGATAFGVAAMQQIASEGQAFSDKAVPVINQNLANLVDAGNEAIDRVYDNLEARSYQLSKAQIPKPVRQLGKLLDKSINSGLATFQETATNLANVQNGVAENVNKNYAAYQKAVEAPLTGVLTRVISTALSADNTAATAALKAAYGVGKSLARTHQYATKAAVDTFNEVQPRSLGGQHQLPYVVVNQPEPLFGDVSAP